MRYANIIVNISLEQLDKMFQYLVPDHLESQIYAGVPVEIPFGSSNRLIRGYVIEVTDKPEFALDKMKEIHGLVKGSIPIESQLINLAWWIKENYGSTMNQALKTVLPIKLKIKAKETKSIKLAISPKEAEDLLITYRRKNYTARIRLLEELTGQESIPYDLAVHKLNIGLSTIRSLEQQNIVRVVAEECYRNPVKASNRKTEPLILTSEQKKIVDDIVSSMETGNSSTHLIHGVTGSGKTEVYMQIISETIKHGKQAIVLIPEIALTYQTVLRFYQKFGDRVSIINSRLSAGEKYDQFERAKNGGIDIMIGPRSALFTPFRNLGLIIIDEEHEGAYKSETIPKYHARETAIKRASMTGATVVLGSATPSVESYYKALSGEYRLHELKSRANKSELPKVYTVDLREELKEGNKTIFSNKLHELILDRLEKKQQIILFINRRGYAGFVSCRACGKSIRCPHCDVSLTVHNNKKLVCHYCGYDTEIPKTCPVCGSPYIAAFGTGTQKVEAMVRARYPDARVLRMDLDTTSKKDGHEKILSAFANHEADILIGTQMIVKGHDFPLVTLVGVLAADLSLHANDYRASERTFQLLTQAAGRAGRGVSPGEVVIQTYSPEHYSIETAAKQDYLGFYQQEILYRTLLKYPPVSNMAAILISSKEEETANQDAELLSSMIDKQNQAGVRVIGPAPASLSKINDIFRNVIYIKHENYAILTSLKNAIERETEQSDLFKNSSIQFDFTPMSNY